MIDLIISVMFCYIMILLLSSHRVNSSSVGSSVKVGRTLCPLELANKNKTEDHQEQEVHIDISTAYLSSITFHLTALLIQQFTLQ